MAKILIVGAGVSGLSAGIYGCLSGHDVIICERNSSAGGNLTGWWRDGYHIDNCIHWLTGTNKNTATYSIWETLGALDGTPIRYKDSLYTVEDGGIGISLKKDLSDLERDMLRISPEDKKEIKRLMGAVMSLRGLSGIAGEGANEKITFSAAIGSLPSLAYYYSLSTGALARKFKSPLLGKFIVGFLGEDFGSLALLAVMAAFTSGNGGIPEGGSLAMARRMAKRFLSLGGELRLGARVSRILSDKGRAGPVILSDSERIEADHIIIAADPAAIFGNVISAPMPRAIKRQYTSRRLKRFSSYHHAFACDVKPSFVGDLIIDVPEKYRSVIKSSVLILKEFSHEPSFSPSSKTLIQTMSFCDEREALSVISLYERSKELYCREKEKMAAAVEYLITEKFPELKNSLSLIDSWGPATYKRYTGAPSGAYMASCIPSLYIPKCAPCRVSGFNNLYIATQWQSLPGGLPNAAACGKKAIEEINRVEHIANQKTKKPTIALKER